MGVIFTKKKALGEKIYNVKSLNCEFVYIYGCQQRLTFSVGRTC